MIRHLIVTRLGVAINRPSYYEHHIALLRNGLFACLKAQTNRDFEWVIITDSRIPAEHRDAVQDMVSRVGGSVVLFDPLETLRLMPNAKEIAGDNDVPVLMSRIDDDDIICADFVEQLQNAVAETTIFPVSVAFADGLQYYLDYGAYHPYVSESIALGLSVLAPAEKPISPYAGGHNKLHERTEAAGGKAIVLRTEKPMWAYVRRGTSNSLETSLSGMPKRARPADEVTRDFLRRCRLPRDWFDTARKLHQAENDPRPAIVGSSLNRMTIKVQYLVAMREIRAAGMEDSDRYRALMAAVYAF